MTTSRTVPARYPDRMHTDRAAVEAILDEALYCHIAFVADGEPRLLPTLHVRIGDTLYTHGSTGSTPLLMARRGRLPVCVAVTLIDGIVFSRAQFHHSINYRSVIVHGLAQAVTDTAARRTVLTMLVEKIASGRTADSRPPTQKELASTALLAVPLTEAGAKVRTGGPREEEEDLSLPYWSGVLPLRLVAGEPEPEDPGMPVPSYLLDRQA